MAKISYPIGNKSGVAIPAGSIGQIKSNTGSAVAMVSNTYTTVCNVTLTDGWWLVSANVFIDHNITTASSTIMAILLSYSSDSSTAGNTEGHTQYSSQYVVSSSNDYQYSFSGKMCYCDGVNIYVYKTDSTFDTIPATNIGIRVFMGTYTVGSSDASGNVTAIRIA